MTHGTEAVTPDGRPARPSTSRAGRRLALILLTIVAVIAALLAGGAYAFAAKYDGRALPGTTVIGQDVAGKTSEEISTLVAQHAKDVKVNVTADGQTHKVSLEEVGVTVDAKGTAQAAMSRDASFGSKVKSLWSGEHTVDPVVSVDEAAAAAYAKGLVAEDDTSPVNAGVSYDEDKGEWSVTPAKEGKGVDPEAFVTSVSAHAAALKDFSVEQEITTIQPAITTQDAEKVVGTIASVLEQPMTIAGPNDKTYEVSAERRNSWLKVDPDESGKKLVLSVDEQAVKDWVSARADRSTVKVVDGIEQVDEQGKVVKVVAEKKDGVEITNTDAVATELIAALKGASPLETAFESKTIQAKVTKAKAPKDKKPEDPAGDKAPAPTGEKWIDVDLSAKTVTAYVGDTPVWGPRTMVDGKPGNETATGSYRIYLRYDKQDMTNEGYYPKGHEKYYYTKNVPWVQYFYRGYAFHGAPWRSSFGYSASHGCINMPVADAKWLYDWAGMGTRVEVHR